MPVDYAAAALAAARRWCGWAVTPPEEDVTVTVDGPGTKVLSLPSLHVTEVTAVAEDGVELDVDDLRISRNGQIRKRSGACWTSAYAGVVVTMTHGYTTAPDFDAAVEQAAASLTASASRDAAVKREKIVDVEYEWFADGSVSQFLNTSLLAPYRILPGP